MFARLLLIPFLAAWAAAAPAPGDRPLPHGPGVLDVTRPPYNAVPDGVTDCTAAIQRALDDGRGATIYLPKGTYLISDTLRWPGPRFNTVTLWGESRAETILRLPDAAPGYTDHRQPKAMLWTGQKPAQRFKNYVRHLTLHTGSGNPGAIGAQFMANNTGAFQDVTIRSGDGAGAIGLDLGYTDEQGPCLIKHVRVEGFEVGVSLRHTVDSVTMEFIELVGQRRVAVDNGGQVLSIRHLWVEGAPLAVRNAAWAVLTLVDSTLAGHGPAAVENRHPAQLLLRDVTTAGFAAAAVTHEKEGAETVLAPGGTVAELAYPTAVGAFGAPARTLRLPVEETPDLPWQDPAEWVGVDRFGAVPAKDEQDRNIPDSTAAYQAAIDSGARTVYIPWGRHRLEGDVFLRGRVERLIGLGQGARTLGPGRIIVEDGDAPVVVIENLQGTGAGVVTRTARTVVLRNLALEDISTPFAQQAGFVAERPVRLFLEDAVGCTWIFPAGSQVWGRQWNTEHPEVKIVAQNTDLWILGLKAERGSTLVDARGGRSELLGIFTYTTSEAAGRPLLRVRDGQLSATIGEACFNGKPLQLLLQAERAGQVFELRKGEVPPRTQGSVAALVSVHP